MKYTYELQCPCCKLDTIIETSSRVPIPAIYCGTCPDPVEIRIVRVHVDGEPVEGQDGVNLFHQLTEQLILQRSTL